MRDVKKRIKRYRLECGLKPVEVARELGVSRGAVYHWEDLSSTTMPDVVNLIGLSRLFGRSVSDILGQEVSAATGNKPGGGAVPVISLKDVKSADFLSDIHVPGFAERHVPCPDAHGPDTFAAHMLGTANVCNGVESIPPDTLLFFDPGREVVSGDMVLAQLPSGSVIVRQLIDEGDERFLLPLNTQYSRTDMPFRVVAVVIGTYRATRRVR